MKKDNGFTLIELIAVITLLAIIILVSVPVLINTLSKTEQNEYKDFEMLVTSAAELYLERNIDLYPDFDNTGETIDISLKTLIDEGYLKNDLEVPVNNKEILKYKVVVTIGQDEIFDYKLELGKTFAEILTTSNEVPSIPECLTNEEVCTPGTIVAIKVNEREVYNFYVINETDAEITLIMDRNLYSTEDLANRTHNVAWINAEDYAEANADDNTNCTVESCNDEGPITAIKTLKQRTSGWSNIPERVYTYSDDGGRNRYQSFQEKMRARMLTITEANNIVANNNNTLPSWMYINLNSTGDNNTKGYSMSSASSSYNDGAYSVSYRGFTFDSGSVYNTDYRGLRPVITLSKSQ